MLNLAINFEFLVVFGWECDSQIPRIKPLGQTVIFVFFLFSFSCHSFLDPCFGLWSVSFSHLFSKGFICVLHPTHLSHKKLIFLYSKIITLLLTFLSCECWVA